jgi:hypothetical protein
MWEGNRSTVFSHGDMTDKAGLQKNGARNPKQNISRKCVIYGKVL